MFGPSPHKYQSLQHAAQVRFSTLPSMQSLGDSSTTLGLLFAAIGVGCFIGPVVSNKLTPTRCALSYPSCSRASTIDWLSKGISSHHGPSVLVEQ